MATFSEMKEAIASDMTRDDLLDELESTLERHIQKACEYYADTKFWFNSVVTTVSASTQDVTIPAGVRVIERLTLPAYYTEVRECTLREIRDDNTTGAPDYYSYLNNTIRLYPTPDRAYTLRIYGIAQIDAPSSASDTSVWTNEARELIEAHTRMTLRRNKFRDPEGVQMEIGAVQDELRRLKRETAKRLETMLRPQRTGHRYNVLTDR